MRNRNIYFLDIASKVAELSTCSRAKVGAILVSKSNEILSTGYNGSPRNTKHCLNHYHIMNNNHCIATVHAELNAILNAAKNGISIKDCILYSTHHPCFRCMQVLINIGIKNVYYRNDYKDEFQYFYKHKIKCIKVKNG